MSLLLLTIIACLPTKGLHDRPGDEENRDRGSLDVDEVVPAFTTSAGGDELEILGGPFDGSARVFFDDVEAVVIEVSGDTVTVLAPALDDGMADVVVETDANTGALDDALRVFTDGTGLAGAFGAFEYYELQGDYWQTGDTDFGLAWWGLINPQDVHYWDIFDTAQDSCISGPSFPDVQLTETGLAYSNVEHAGAELQMMEAEDRFFERNLNEGDFLALEDYDVPSLQSPYLPEFGIPGLATVPDHFDLYEPYLYGALPPTIARNEVVIEWGDVEADQVLILLERMDPEFNDIEVVGCRASNDGTFRVPSSVWEESWVPGQWLYIYVGAAVETKAPIAINNSESRVAGVRWLLGAAITE